MIWLNLTDFDKQIRTDVLTMIIEANPFILDDAERATIAEMESYLRLRYDVATIFTTTGTHRNQLLVMYAVDILLYHIHSRINPRQVPQIRIDRYESAIRWLQMVAKGLLAPNLPLLQTQQGSTDANIIYQGFQKRKNNY